MNQDESTEGRRVFLEVRDLSRFIAELDGPAGLFVPTRLPLALGTVFLLAIRLRSVSRAVEVPMLVVGRRVPRGGSLLSGGVMARPTDGSSPLVELLREVASGRVVDLEARIQEQQRLPAVALFNTTAEAIVELRALVEGPARFPVDRLVSRDDRLALQVKSDEDGLLVTPHVSVRSVSVNDGIRSAAVELFDEQGRTIVAELLAQLENRLARA